MFTKIDPQFRKVLYKWTPQEAKLLPFYNIAKVGITGLIWREIKKWQ
jgi:hypothetical protein